MMEIWFIFCIIGGFIWAIFGDKIENLGQAIFWAAIICYFAFDTHFAINITDKNSPMLIESKDGRPIVTFFKEQSAKNEAERTGKKYEPVTAEQPLQLPQTNGSVEVKGSRLKYNGVYYVKDAFQTE